jgi:5-methylcytosine-specific restriction endonuclease McrA
MLCDISLPLHVRPIPHASLILQTAVQPLRLHDSLLQLGLVWLRPLVGKIKHPYGRISNEERKSRYGRPKQVLEMAKSLAQVLAKEESWFSNWGFPGVEGWLLSGSHGHCVYCDRDLFSSPDVLLCMATTDHLFSARDYSELAHCPWNLVLCCRYCNTKKRTWDPNRAEQPIYDPREHHGTLTKEQRDKAITLTRAYLTKKREEDKKWFERVQKVFRTTQDALLPHLSQG